MPLDSHHHLRRLGWAGTGSALREGGISRPLNVTQKKTLAGVGKDRDEAFPFWDHVFTAAAKSIVIKVPGGGSETSDSDSDQPIPTPMPAPTPLARTATGIISNRRPTNGMPALSGSSTPVPPSGSGYGSGTQTPNGAGVEGPKLSLLAMAKQQAARSQLYSRFFRGPVIRMEDEDEGEGVDEVRGEERKEVIVHGVIEKEVVVQETEEVQVEVVEMKMKKRKREEVEETSDVKRVERLDGGDGEKKKKKKRKRDEDAAMDGGVPSVLASESTDKPKKKTKKSKALSDELQSAPATTAAPNASSETAFPSRDDEAEGAEKVKKKEKRKRDKSKDAASADVDAEERKREKKRRRKERELAPMFESTSGVEAAAVAHRPDTTPTSGADNTTTNHEERKRKKKEKKEKKKRKLDQA